MANRLYRKRRGDGNHQWHFCTNCPSWPAHNFDAEPGPVSPVCSQCLTLEKRQMCVPFSVGDVL